MLTVALQNAVERRDLGIATASANLVRALGGAVGVALFAAAGLLVVLLLEELPLRGAAPAGARA